MSCSRDGPDSDEPAGFNTHCVSHTAIVENKRLGHALALIKAQQAERFEAKVKTNSEKDGYQKRGRQIYGPDYVPKIPAKAAIKESIAKRA